MKFDVVVFGSSFVDIYLNSLEFKLKKDWLCQTRGGKLRVDKMVITTGGGASNVSVGLERLGLQTGCVTAVGRDHWGLFIRQELKKEGVSQQYIQQTEEQTSMSIILVTENGERTALVYRGASNALSWQQVPWDKLEPEWFYVSSLGGDFSLLTKIIRRAKEKRIKIALNPGSNEINCPEKLLPFIKAVDLLILNLAEAGRLTRHETTKQELIYQDLKKTGAGMMAITNGKKGAVLLAGRKKIIKTEAIKVKTKEETGAGDAFGCGLTAGLIKYTDLSKALKLGAINGAAVTEKYGPKAGLLFEPEADNWLKK